MPRTRYHIGLRTAKTALAVVLALHIAHLRGGDAIPIFAAIGAISVMTRRLSDAKRMVREQTLGTLLGTGFGLVLLFLPSEWRILAIGVGIVIMLPLCFPLRIANAVPLTAIVFVSIALFTPADGSPLVYVCNRFLDTFIGLATGFCVNYAIKPYNNRMLLAQMMGKFADRFPVLLDECLLRGHYPNLCDCKQDLRNMQEELEIFDAQIHTRYTKRKGDAAHLYGCLQLCDKMYTELAALCTMDDVGTLHPDNVHALTQLGLQPTAIPPFDGSTVSLVRNYHLQNLLQAHGYLRELLGML